MQLAHLESDILGLELNNRRKESKKNVDAVDDLDRTRQNIYSSKKDEKITQKRMKIVDVRRC